MPIDEAEPENDSSKLGVHASNVTPQERVASANSLNTVNALENEPVVSLASWFKGTNIAIFDNWTSSPALLTDTTPTSSCIDQYFKTVFDPSNVLLER